MPERIDRLAEVSVARGCGFAALAIGLIFVGALPAGIPAALTLAGLGALATCAYLILKAGLAERRPYKRTEVWYMLKENERPAPVLAQQSALIATVMLTGGWLGRLLGI